MKKTLMMCMLGLALSQGARAETSAQYAACRERAGSNAVQVDLCIEKELAVQDTRLNEVYGKLAHQYAKDPAQRKALKTEELAWLKDRDSECQTKDGTGGTRPDCELDKTDSRATELGSRLSQ